MENFQNDCCRSWRVVQYTQSDSVGKFSVSICTVRPIVLALYDLKIASQLRGLKYFSLFTGVKGVSWVVDPYGPYRWNGPLSICTRSENCISLKGLKVYFTCYRCETGLFRLMSCLPEVISPRNERRLTRT